MSKSKIAPTFPMCWKIHILCINTLPLHPVLTLATRTAMLEQGRPKSSADEGVMPSLTNLQSILGT